MKLHLPNLGLHPATRLILWLLLLISVQCMNGVLLGVAVVLLFALPSRVLRRGGRLVWRTRWLLFSPLWIGATAPTREGVAVASVHLGRLILVLMLVAAFLEEMPIADLLSATHTLFKPLRRIRFDPDRGVIRLMLVLRYVETLPRARDWRSLLDVSSVGEPEWLEIDQRPFRFLDVAVVLFFVVLLCYFCFR